MKRKSIWCAAQPVPGNRLPAAGVREKFDSSSGSGNCRRRWRGCQGRGRGGQMEQSPVTATWNKEQGKPRRLSMINNGCAIQCVNKKILSSAARDQNKAKQGKAKEKERESQRPAVRERERKEKREKSFFCAANGAGAAAARRTVKGIRLPAPIV